MTKKTAHQTKKVPFFRRLAEQRWLLLMSMPFVVWLVIFKYVPLWGWTMAFQEVRPATFKIPFLERAPIASCRIFPFGFAR